METMLQIFETGLPLICCLENMNRGRLREIYQMNRIEKWPTGELT